MRKIVLLSMLSVLCGAVFAGDSPLEAPLPIYMWGLTFSHTPIFYAAVCAFVIFTACFLWSRGLSKDQPNRGQIFLEMLIGEFDKLTSSGFGTQRRGRVYLAWIATLFMFIWACNMTGLFPLPAFSLFNFPVPAPAEPTANVNTTVSMALLFVLMIGHGSAVYYHNFFGYVKEYFSPGGLIGLVMFPLNAVGKVAEIVSISFRLFGNIFGGSVIITVVSGLVAYIGLPIFLYGFFGIFVGTVQAFVFAMLALTYIASNAAEENTEGEITNG